MKVEKLRPILFSHLDGFGDSRCFADDLNLGMLGQQSPKVFSSGRLVINNQGPPSHL